MSDYLQRHPEILHTKPNPTPETDSWEPRWLTTLVFEMPDGAAVHPALYDTLEEVLADHQPMMLMEIGKPGISCWLRGNSPDEITADAAYVAATFLRVLGLPVETPITQTCELVDPKKILRFSKDLHILDTPPDDEGTD